VTHFYRIVPKWLEIEPDNLHMKFSALNVDFNSLSADPQSSRRPAPAGIEEMGRYLPKKWLFYCY